MTLDKRTRQRMLAHCGQIHDDDGVDPRQFFKTAKHGTVDNRKAMQLCSQVTRTLGLALAGEFGDELLHNLEVVSVELAPNTSQMAVTVRTELSEQGVGIQEIENRLSMVAGRLRSEVAAAITRKRAPKLVFHVIGPE
jgi:ribosome-binding factor A